MRFSRHLAQMPLQGMFAIALLEVFDLGFRLGCLIRMKQHARCRTQDLQLCRMA